MTKHHSKCAELHMKHSAIIPCLEVLNIVLVAFVGKNLYFYSQQFQ